jgi:protein gp37
VVTAGSPSAQVPRLPAGVRMLSLEDRSDPVALLGSLMNVEATNRLTVVFDGGSDGTHDRPVDPYVVGARAADEAGHPELRADLDRLVDLGYLSR